VPQWFFIHVSLNGFVQQFNVWLGKKSMIVCSISISVIIANAAIRKYGMGQKVNEIEIIDDSENEYYLTKSLRLLVTLLQHISWD
jgi:hypothetical protein